MVEGSKTKEKEEKKEVETGKPEVESKEKEVGSTSTKLPPEVTLQHLEWAEILWEYMHLNHTLEKSQVILVLGSNDVRVAEYGARLWLDGYGDYLMFSGYLGNLTEGVWSRPEYEVFREVALSSGVPSERILVETRATNTGQNVRLSYEVLREAGLLPHLRSLLLVHTPYMERRTLATFARQWPEVGGPRMPRVHVTSPPIPLALYHTTTLTHGGPSPEVEGTRAMGTLGETIGVLLSMFHRILTYPSKGYQVRQEVPSDVARAYKALVALGTFNNVHALQNT